jgi:hypothetical protein
VPEQVGRVDGTDGLSVLDLLELVANDADGWEMFHVDAH